MENKKETTLEQLEALELGLKTRLNEVQTRIEQLKKKEIKRGVVTEPLKPGDKIWVISNYHVNGLKPEKKIVDNLYIEFENNWVTIGDAFYDKKSCQKEIEKRLFLQEYFEKVRELNKKYDWVVDWNDIYEKKYFFYLNNNNILTSYNQQSHNLPTQYYFHEQANQELIKHFGNRLMLLF
jgi:hypothetical protein